MDTSETCKWGRQRDIFDKKVLQTLPFEQKISRVFYVTSFPPAYTDKRQQAARTNTNTPILCSRTRLAHCGASQSETRRTSGMPGSHNSVRMQKGIHRWMGGYRRAGPSAVAMRRCPSLKKAAIIRGTGLVRCVVLKGGLRQESRRLAKPSTRIGYSIQRQVRYLGFRVWVEEVTKLRTKRQRAPNTTSTALSVVLATVFHSHRRAFGPSLS